jgi:EAL domain-containing protein (putative c-di-GMP-specific phosphodiesterase class I)/GGDEF domain-containing protein
VVLFHVIQRPNAALISSFSVAALVLIAVTFMFSPEDTALGLRVLTQALILLVIMRIFSLVFVRLTENTRSLLALLDEKTKTLEGHLTRAKITDQRLSVLNRKGFSQYLEQQLAQTVSSAGHYELIFIRAYHLYASPRIFSPEEEDIYYGSLVDRLRQFVSLDTEIGRVGQFDLAVAVFLPSTGKSRQPLDVHAMQRRLSEPVLINGKKMSPDIRLGMVTITDPGEPVAQWMEWASMALLESLKERKTPVSFFDQSMLDQVRFGELIRGSLPAAFDRREFQVVYQPIVDLHDGKLVRAEALVRWAHPELGLIGPDTFISLVESEHMMYQLTRLVFEEVSRARDHWLHTLGENIQVGVNVSASTLESPEQIYKLAAIFNPSGIKGAQGIVFEITESLFLAAIDTTKDVILKLRDQGFSFALDDFGVGYSSLSYLSQFKLDYLKIDRSFVDQIENDKDKQAIVKAVVDVAHALSMRVVAEGIENQEQRDLLLALNCDLGQGYLFSKPLTSDDFQSLLQSQTSQ